MRKLTTGIGMICCVAAATFLGACNKNADNVECQDKAACCEQGGSAGIVGEKKCCKDSEASPGIVSEKSCSSSCQSSCTDKAASPGMVSEKSCKSSCTKSAE